MPWKRSPRVSPSNTIDEDFEEDPPLSYNHVFPDFTIDQINDMNSQSHLKKNVDDDSASLDSTAKISSLNFSKTSNSSNNTTPTGHSERKNVWSLMTRRRQGGFDFDEEDEEDYQSLNGVDNCKALLNGLLYESRHCLQTLIKHPYIYISTGLVFAGLTAACLIVVEMICERSKDKEFYEAQWEALETANWFSEMFAKSLIPLRSLQQAVIHSEHFKHLPREIGNYGQPGAAEPIFGMKSDTVKDYRNVTGICDNEVMIEEFHQIVEGINDIFDFDGIVVNYRLAPYGVFCASDPLVNIKDFDADNPMDSSMIIGWDPLNSMDARWGQVVRKVYSNETAIDIFGPMKMHGAEMFCAHLSVPYPGYNLTVDDKNVHTWGFVMHFIHWSRLKEQSGIDERFKKKGLLYRLVRTDQMKNPETGMMMDHDVVIAHNLHTHGIDEDEDDRGHLHHLHNERRVSVSIMTPNGEWAMHVFHACGLTTLFIYIRILTVIGCLIISIMFGLVLLERQLHKILLYKIMPKGAIEKLNRGQTVVEKYNIVTIFFSDIVGFTSLAGEMSPIQVMKMLNELYLQFDRIVEKHGVYKVETIGDAYMVVGGAPDRIPAPEAAQRVALFALEIMEFVKNFLTTDGDRIFIRAGIASGPVVAGVVGTAMPRYCFFGDTVNLASRMESNSKKMKIQCSDYTSRLLQDSPEFSFDLRQRIENGVSGIHVKGKGITQTWWINNVRGLNLLSKSRRNLNVEPRPSCAGDNIIQSIALSKQEWLRLGLPDSPLVAETSDISVMINRVTAILEHRLTILIAKRQYESSLSNAARKDLRNYVAEIASMYHDVHFHNFEHAVHVTTSMNKLIDTIVESVGEGKEEGNGSISRKMWENTNLHFAMIFACLIHDVCHTGCSNKILASQNHKIAKVFSGPSAERHSIKTSLNLLFRPKYKNFRKALFPDIKAKFEFGRCIFWSILCTDIATPERVKNCKSRYEVAHSVKESIEAAKVNETSMADPSYDPELCPLLPLTAEVLEYLRITQEQIKENPKELIICQEGLENCVLVEHLTQVSDVAHLMQSYDVFLKYNLRLYKELMACHEKGFMPDPSSDWAIGQIGFLSHYVIPLALRSEILMGTETSKLNLSKNAIANMDRWEVDGEVITEIFITGWQHNKPDEDILNNALKVGGQMHQC